MNRRSFLKHTSAAALALAAIPTIPALLKRDSVPLSQTAHAAPEDEPKHFRGEDTFDRLLKMAEDRNWRALPMGALVGAIGMELRGVPYVGSTLELYDDREVCSVNLLGLDCVTFFESALGFARMLKRGNSTIDALMQEVAHTRYRDGQVTDYTSRLHYTADWFYNNEEKRVVKSITRELPGSTRFTKQVNFMSTHPDSYRQLKANPKLVPVIAEIERHINSRTMHYVPKEKVAAVESLLKTGDIIGITTTIDGIDCSHTGLCYRDEKGVAHLLHASLTKKEVILDEAVSKYLAGVSKHTGIMVVRPVEL